MKKILFVWMCSILSVCQGWAAPSVKMLGGGNALPGVSKTTVVKSSGTQNPSSNSVRASSVRAVKSVNTKSVQDNKKVSDANVARLSVGQYLHNAGVVSKKIKPINVSDSSVSNAESSAELNRLDTQINQLNEQITQLSNQLTELNSRVGVDVAEKDTQANASNFINKIEVDEDGKTLKVSRSNVKIPIGSANGSPVAAIWIEE